jgi:hypothetical protein
LEGTLEDEGTWADIAEILFKLVVYGIPSGRTVASELTAMLALFEGG